MTSVLVERSCPRCTSPGPHTFTVCEKGPHYAGGYCAKCNQHFFAPKPDTDPTKYKRPAAHRDLVKEFSKGNDILETSDVCGMIRF